jgi:ferritin-like metal-binding protein YciE
MQIANFKDMYITALQALASVERQLAEALQQMADAASHSSLKNALMHHRDETAAQARRLETILRKHGANAQAHTDQAMQALVAVTKKMHTMLRGEDLRDTGLIASAQKLEHYEIAAYGTASGAGGSARPARRSAPAASEPGRGEAGRRGSDEARQGRDQPGCAGRVTGGASWC